MRRTTAVATIVLASVLATFGEERAEARPQYLREFAKTYPDLKEPAMTVKCAVCHCAKDKRAQNDYGEAIRKALGAKNVKNPPLIVNALRAAEKEPSDEPGKTFGELIGEGRLPDPCPGEEPASSTDAQFRPLPHVTPLLVELPSRQEQGHREQDR